MKSLEAYHIGNFNDSGFDQHIQEQVTTEGLAIFDGMYEPQQLEELAGMFDGGEIRRQRQFGGNGISELVADPDNPIDPDSDTELNPHTDGTRVENPAHLLTLYCKEPDTQGGGVSMYLSGADLYKRIERKSPELLEALHTPWLFGTEDDGYRAPVFETKEDTTALRFRRDRFDSYTESMRLALDQVLTGLTVDGITQYLALRPGQGAAVNNRSMLHGRTPILGRRVLVRANVDLSPELGDQLGFRVG